ncbi:lysozyme [Acidihalobacter prosperus]|uniref:Lysozyme n=1 Tax=Acidihalobacter prosperus TaxID=160660 RepID=A0A1A6C7A3_9GAMM|nr:lysozyme [Acidihalobacter prosperus]OBS10429.1 hypothetical protein Thpro_020145 [Acidihalobacter prosperus]
MTLTPNTLSKTDYQDLIYQMLKDFEGVNPYAYNDTNNNPTIGLGFEIKANAPAILKGMGYSAASFGNNSVKFNNFVSALQAVGEGAYPDSGPDGESVKLQAAINKIANEYLGTHYGEHNKKTGKINPNFGYGNNTGGSGLTADQQIQATFNHIEGTYETTLDSWLQGVQIPDSTERAALLSLTYNNLIGPGKSPHLHAAIASSNRAEAWYQIRYNSNGGPAKSQPGIAKRRYDEAAIFGLYAPGAVTQAEALQIYQMCTAHGLNNLKAYDKQHAWSLTHAQSISYANGTAQTPLPESLPSTLLPAAQELSSLYGNGQSFNALDIFAASANRTDVSATLTVPNSPALLLAGSGADTLVGTLTGNDVLVAGTGSDMLAGGTGVNRYDMGALASVANVTDTINDSGGQGSIWLGATQLGGGSGLTLNTASNGSLVWTASDGTQYAFTPGSGADAGIGTLSISGGALGTGDQIVIDHFDLSKAQASGQGYLGIHLNAALALEAGTQADSLPEVLAHVTAASPPKCSSQS